LLWLPKRADLAAQRVHVGVAARKLLAQHHMHLLQDFVSPDMLNMFK
jgi:hypothetical protein